MYVSIGWFVVSLICTILVGLFIVLVVVSVALILLKHASTYNEEIECPDKLEGKINE